MLHFSEPKRRAKLLLAGNTPTRKHFTWHPHFGIFWSDRRTLPRQKREFTWAVSRSAEVWLKKCAAVPTGVHAVHIQRRQDHYVCFSFRAVPSQLWQCTAPSCLGNVIGPVQTKLGFNSRPITLNFYISRVQPAWKEKNPVAAGCGSLTWRELEIIKSSCLIRL